MELKTYITANSQDTRLKEAMQIALYLCNYTFSMGNFTMNNLLPFIREMLIKIEKETHLPWELVLTPNITSGRFDCTLTAYYHNYYRQASFSIDALDLDADIVTLHHLEQGAITFPSSITYKCRCIDTNKFKLQVYEQI